MTVVLADHNAEGQAKRLYHTMTRLGWVDLLTIALRTFSDIELDAAISDRMHWRFAQAHRMLLLTDNRTKKEADSLEQTLREELTETSLPVLTVRNAVSLLNSEGYRAACAERIATIRIDVELYYGVPRLYIP